MATSRKPAAKRAAEQRAMIRKIMLLEALRNWAIPLPLGAAALVLAVLYNIELVSPARAVALAGALALLAGLFAGLRDFIHERTKLGTAALAGAFAVAFFAVNFAALYRDVNPPPPVFATELHAGAPVTIPLHGAGGSYKLLLQGHFPPAEQGVNRSAHYVLDLDAGADHHVFEGDFTEEWGRTRLGRRGSAPVHTVHALSQQRVSAPSGSDLTLKLDQIGPSVGDSVDLHVYSAAFPLALYAGLGFLLTLAALTIDALHVESGTPSATAATIGALAGVTAFRLYAGPIPGFGDLIVYGGLGAFVGILVAPSLWRVLRPALRRVVRPIQSEA